jgi:hypothetical protein
MKKILVVATLAIVLSGCAVLTGVKKYFCALPVNSIITQLQANVQDINANYNTYVALLLGGDQTVKPWVVAADGFLAQASPLIVGLQQGTCYAADMITNALNTYQAAKAAAVKK